MSIRHARQRPPAPEGGGVMGWLWWLLIAVVLGGVVWWLATRSKDDESTYGEAGAAARDREQSVPSEPSAPSHDPFGDASAAAAADAPAAAAANAPGSDASGTAADDSGWAPVDDASTTPDQAASAADVEVPSDASETEDNGWTAGAYQEPEADPSYTPTHLPPNARDTSLDPAASPETTPAPETGAGEGFGGAAIGGTAETSEGPFGPGSAEPTADGSAPGAAYTVKGNVDSMRFHGPESPYYNRTTAEVWFTDADTARAAGFTPWNEI